jgi:protocatechuate 3,4-dioxygenase beta subunit
MIHAGRLLRNRYVVVFGSLVLVTAAWNAYVALHNDGIVAGRVVTTDGRPVPGATVALYERTLTTLEPRASATTGDDGRFLFKGLKAHHLVLEARKDGAGTAPRTAYRLYFRGQNVTLPSIALMGPAR